MSETRITRHEILRVRRLHFEVGRTIHPALIDYGTPHWEAIYILPEGVQSALKCTSYNDNIPQHKQHQVTVTRAFSIYHFDAITGATDRDGLLNFRAYLDYEGCPTVFQGDEAAALIHDLEAIGQIESEKDFFVTIIFDYIPGATPQSDDWEWGYAGIINQEKLALISERGA